MREPSSTQLRRLEREARLRRVARRAAVSITVTVGSIVATASSAGALPRPKRW